MTIPIVKIPVQKFHSWEFREGPSSKSQKPQSHFPSMAGSIGNGNILHHIAIGGSLKRFHQKTLPRSAMLCEAVPFSKPPGRVPVLCGRGTGTAVVPLRPAVLPRTAQRDKWLGRWKRWDRGNGLPGGSSVGYNPSDSSGISRVNPHMTRDIRYLLSGMIHQVVFEGFFKLQTLGICRTVKFVSQKNILLCFFGGRGKVIQHIWWSLKRGTPNWSNYINIVNTNVEQGCLFSQAFIFTTKSVLNLPFSNQPCWRKSLLSSPVSPCFLFFARGFPN